MAYSKPVDIEGATLENLHHCIEQCTINNGCFYYDTRLGTKIDEYALHPVYKKCIKSTAEPVDSIVSITRNADAFHVCLISNNLQVQTIVKFYEFDKTFVCRNYDPTKIIPRILAQDESYFTDHPFYKFGYIVNYSWASDDTYDSNLDVEVKYTAAAEDILYNKTPEVPEVSRVISRYRNSMEEGAPQITYDDDKSDISELHYVDEPDESYATKKYNKYFTGIGWDDENPETPGEASECGSCGIPEFESNFLDNTDHDDLPTITQADIDDLENMFGNKSNVQSEDDFVYPRKPLRKLAHETRYDAEENSLELQNIIQECAQKRQEEFIRMRNLHRILSEVSDYEPPAKDLIPVLPPRADNL